MKDDIVKFVGSPYVAKIAGKTCCAVCNVHKMQFYVPILLKDHEINITMIQQLMMFALRQKHQTLLFLNMIFSMPDQQTKWIM